MTQSWIEKLKEQGLNLNKFSEQARLLKEWKSQTGEEYASSSDDGVQQRNEGEGVEPGSIEGKILDSPAARSLAGPIGTLHGYYFPADLFGGCCPRIPGEEEEIVWNAAAEAADTERVHIVWQARGDKIWYLAVRSADLSSNPDTWCPFASMLPGQKDARPLPACYTYYTDEAATMMTVTEDNLLIHRGTSSVLHVKAERTVRELGEDVVITELMPDMIEKLTPVAWYSLSLFEDRARRILAALSVLAALGLAGIAIFIWLLASMAVIGAHSDLSEIQQRTQEKSTQLLMAAQSLRSSSVRQQMAKFAELNDSLVMINGYLEVYQVGANGRVLWRAVVPNNVTSNRITEIGGQTLETREQSVVIGNSRDVLSLKRGR